MSNNLIQFCRFPLKSLITLGLVLLVAPLTGSAAPAPGKKVAITNLDFEKDLDGWKNAKSGAAMVTVSAASGHEGKGVQVDDADATLNARVTSDKAPATSGKTYEVHFYGRTVGGAKGVAGYLVFYGNDGKPLPPDPAGNNYKDVSPFTEWTEATLSAIAPADTVSVGVEIRSNKASITKGEFDDFKVYELP